MPFPNIPGLPTPGLPGIPSLPGLPNFPGSLPGISMPTWRRVGEQLSYRADNDDFTDTDGRVVGYGGSPNGSAKKDDAGDDNAKSQKEEEEKKQSLNQTRGSRATGLRLQSIVSDETCSAPRTPLQDMLKEIDDTSKDKFRLPIRRSESSDKPGSVNQATKCMHKNDGTQAQLSDKDLGLTPEASSVVTFSTRGATHPGDQEAGAGLIRFLDEKTKAATKFIDRGPGGGRITGGGGVGGVGGQPGSYSVPRGSAGRAYSNY